MTKLTAKAVAITREETCEGYATPSVGVWGSGVEDFGRRGEGDQCLYIYIF